MRRSILPLAAALALGACAVGPGYERPPTPVPTAYRGDTVQVVDDTAAAIGPLVPPAVAPNDTIAQSWEETLGDSVLLALMDTALVHNQDLLATIAVTREFQAQYAIARSGFYPQVDLFGAGGTGKSKVIGVPGVSSDFFEASAEASWELDLWGRVRRTSEAGKASYYARTEELRGAELSLAAAVATGTSGSSSSTSNWRWRSARWPRGRPPPRCRAPASARGRCQSWTCSSSRRRCRRPRPSSPSWRGCARSRSLR